MCCHIKTVKRLLTGMQPIYPLDKSRGQTGTRTKKPIRSRLTLAGNVPMMGTFIGSGVAANAEACKVLVQVRYNK